MGRGHVALAPTLAVAAVAVPAAAARAGGVPRTVVASGSPPGAKADIASLLRTRAAAAAFPSRLRREEARRVAVVDLTHSALLAIVAPVPSCGWSARVAALARSGTRLRVRFAARLPAKRALVCEALSLAYAVLRLPRSQVAGVVRATPART